MGIMSPVESSLMDPAVLPAGRPWQELHFPCGIIPTGFPGSLVVKNLSALQSLGQEGLLEKEMTTTPVSLPGQFHGEDPWQPTVHGVQRVRHDFHYTYSISQPGFLWLCSPQTHDWCLMSAHSNQLPDYLSNQPPINLQPDGNGGDWWLFRERVSPWRAPSAGGARRGIWGRQDPQDILNSIMTSLRLGLLFLE